MSKFSVYNTAKYIFHRFDLLRARTGLFALKPASKFAQIFKAHLSYDDALKNIKQVYPWDENNFSALKGGSENIKPLLPNTIDVSFIVPCYNAEKYLERCAKSLVNQKTDVSYEIIFVNDGSTDGTQKILESLKKKYGEKVRVIEQKNQGISAARNAGIENARGKYLGFIDDDDFVSENYLDELYKRTKSSADIVQLAYDCISPDEKLISVVNHQKDVSISENQNQLMKYCYGFVWSGLIKKSLFENIRFPYGFWYEDMILVMALVRLCKRYEYLSKTLYHHTIHKTSASKTLWNDKNAKSLDQLLLPLLIAKYSKNVLKLTDDAFLYKRILHEYSTVLYLRTKNVRGGVRKSLFVAAAKILGDYKQKIDKSELSNFEKATESDFEKRTFLKWKIDGLINRFETILSKG